MSVDILSLAIFAVLVFLGWRSGAFRQVMRIVAIVAVVVGVPFLSPEIRRVVFDEPGRAAPGVEVGSILLAGVLIYVVFALVGWFIVRVMRIVSSILDLLDRLGGAAIGAVKGVVLVYLLAALVVMLEGPIRSHDPDNQYGLVDGRVTSFVSSNNVLAPWQFPDLDRLHRALRIGADIEQTDRKELLGEGSDARAFFDDPRVQTVLVDEELMQWVREDHYPMTLADAGIRSLLNDDEMMEKLGAVEWRKLRWKLEEIERDAE